MNIEEARRSARRVKWFLLAALVPPCILVVGSAPKIVAVTGQLVPRESMDAAMVADLFVVPLVAALLMMPILRSLKRSFLLWAIGIVYLPFGPYVLSVRMLYLLSRQSRLDA